MATRKNLSNQKYRIDASQRPKSPDQRAVDNIPKLPSRVDWQGDAKKATQKYEKQYLRAKATGDNTYITTPKQYAKQWENAARLGQARDTLRRAMYSPVQQANTTTDLNPTQTKKTKTPEETTPRFFDASNPYAPPVMVDQAAANIAQTNTEDVAESAVNDPKGAINSPMQTGEISYSYTPPASSNIGRFLNITNNVWNAYKKALTANESSGGTRNVSGGFNKAYDGIYQQGESAKIAAQEMAAREGITLSPYDQTPKSRQAFLDSLEDQESYLEWFTIDNDRQLSYFLGDKYTSLSPDEKLAILGYAHNQGVGPTVEWVKSGQVSVDGFGTPGTKFSKAVRKNLDELYAMEEVNASALRPQVTGLDRPTYNPQQPDIKAPTIALPNTAEPMEEVNVSALRPQVVGLPDQSLLDPKQPNVVPPMEETITSALRPQVVGLPDRSLLDPKQPNAVPPSTPTASVPPSTPTASVPSSTPTAYDQVILPNQDRNDAFRAAGTNSSPMKIDIRNGALDLSAFYNSEETDANGNPIIENAYLPESGIYTKEQTAKVKELIDKKILKKRDDKEGQYGYTKDDNIRFRGFDKFGALAFDQFTPGTGEAPEITNETLRNYRLTGVNSAKAPITPEQQTALRNAYAATETMMPRNQATQRSALRDPFAQQRRSLDSQYRQEKEEIIKNNKYPSVLLKRLDDKYQSFYTDLEANRRQASKDAIDAEQTLYERRRDAKSDQIEEQKRRRDNLIPRMEGVVDNINRIHRGDKDWTPLTYNQIYAFANPDEIVQLDMNTEQDLINQFPAWFSLAQAIQDKYRDTVTFKSLLQQNSDLVGKKRGLMERVTSLDFSGLTVTVGENRYNISKDEFMQYFPGKQK